MRRYGLIESKNKREIVLLQGLGCRYKACRFCDYYYDVSAQSDELNAAALSEVSGKYGILEVINSGSFGELSELSLERIRETTWHKGIHTLIFECHYLYREEIAWLREYFSSFKIRVKLGLESFDYHLREALLKKGIKEHRDEEIARDFDEANFLVGVEGQNLEMIKYDLEMGLKLFDRICVNVMCDNSKMKTNKELIAEFMQKIYPFYCENERIDFLLENTDFGVG